MPGISRSPGQTHADLFKNLGTNPSLDYDPEDEVGPPSDSEDDKLRHDEGAARQHYERVGKSKLRKEASDLLGPQYEGSKIGRNTALNKDEGRDPFEEFGSDEASDAQDVHGMVGGKSDASSDVGSIDGQESIRTDTDREEDDQNAPSTGSSSNEDEDIESPLTVEDSGQGKNGIDRAEVRRIMNDEHKSAAASIADASRADAEKGRAVKQQRQTFDTLLNCRIRLQQGLIATNAMMLTDENVNGVSGESTSVKAAEQAAMNLWETIESLRSSLSRAKTGSKRKRIDASHATNSPELWGQMEDHEASIQPHRRSILQKWSTKTQAVTTRPTSSRLNQTTRESTVLDVIDDQLANPSRLVQRIRLARSCAPSHAQRGLTDCKDVFDDADFYGIMLKELLEQRSTDAETSAQVDLAAQQWQAARQAGKVKKKVDTKASKGRKMRYTVHEKLQNFMAPEDRGSWGERRIDELFGSLLGRRLVLAENGKDVDGDNEVVADEALKLFRN